MRRKKREKRRREIADVPILHQGAGGSCPGTGPGDTNAPARRSWKKYRLLPTEQEKSAQQ